MRGMLVEMCGCGVCGGQVRLRRCLLNRLVDDKIHKLVEAAQGARDVTVAVELD